jgi:hypothetical protein
VSLESSTQDTVISEVEFLRTYWTMRAKVLEPLPA